MSDWNDINGEVFLSTVKTTGAASERIRLPNQYRKRRFPPQNATMAPGGMMISEDGQMLSVFWHPFSGWADVSDVDETHYVSDADGTHYGNLYFIAPIDGVYWTWAIEKLRRPGETGGTTLDVGSGPDSWGAGGYSDVMDIIFRGKLNSPVKDRDGEKGGGYRPPENALCGFWVGGWPGGTDRRSDVLPWRYKTLTTGDANDLEGGGSGVMERLLPLTIYVDMEALAAALVKGSK